MALKDYPKYTGEEPCTSVDVGLWFIERGTDGYGQKDADRLNKKLKEICADCPIIAECLEWAVVHERYGIWGGTSRIEREQIRRDRGIKYEDPSIVSQMLRDYDGRTKPKNRR